jgi:hypothetical protein
VLLCCCFAGLLLFYFLCWRPRRKKTTKDEEELSVSGPETRVQDTQKGTSGEDSMMENACEQVDSAQTLDDEEKRRQQKISKLVAKTPPEAEVPATNETQEGTMKTAEEQQRTTEHTAETIGEQTAEQTEMVDSALTRDTSGGSDSGA